MPKLDAYVNCLYIAKGRGIVSGLRLPLAIQRFNELEPHLSHFVTTEMDDIARLMEQAGVYLGAMVVMARHQKRRVIEVVRNDRAWPGTIRFPRPLVTEWERKFARFGHRTPFAQVERGVLVHIAGAVAVDLLGEGAT